MNYLKKIGLMLLGGFILFYVSFSLFKGTNAALVNPAFDDINFYKCVVDTYKKYNYSSSSGITYETNLADQQLASITDLWCDQKGIVSIKGVEKLTSLRLLSLIGNKIESVDLGNNRNLQTLRLGNNNWGSTYGNLISEINLNNNVNLVELDLTGNDIKNIVLSNNTKLEKLYLSYNQLTSLDVSNNVNLKVLDLGRRYTCQNTNEYFGCGGVSGSGVTNQITNLNLERNTKLEELYVSGNNLTLLDLSKNTLLKKISVDYNPLSSLNLNNNIQLVELTADGIGVSKINLQNNYNLVYLSLCNNKFADFEINNLTKLKILNFKENPLNNLDISKNVSLEKAYFDMYMYKGTSISILDSAKFPSQFNNMSWSSGYPNYVSVSGNGVCNAIGDPWSMITGTVSNYKLEVFIRVVKKLYSSKYFIDEDNNYIYIGMDDDVDTIKNNIQASGVNLEINNDLLYVKYGKQVLKEFDLIGIKFNNYEINSKKIIIDKKTSYNDFVENIEISNLIRFDLELDGVVVNNGYVEDGMILKIYDVNTGELLDKFKLEVSDNYVDFDDNLFVDSENEVISNIDVGILVDDMINKIDTSGEVIVLDKDDNIIDSGSLKTGDKIRIELSNSTLIYKISILGDVNGDGKSNINDVVQLGRHLINSNVITGFEYLAAGDMNNNSKMDINDIVKLAKRIVSGN